MMKGSHRFGNYLRTLREARRLSLNDVERMTIAAAEPVSRSHLSRLENGRARFSTLKLLALAQLYGLRLSTLVERLEVDHELASQVPATPGKDSAEDLMRKAQEAGLRGEIHHALALYQRAELHFLEGTSDRAQERRVHARLGVARAMLAQGRHRIAKELLEELAALQLPPAETAWTLFLLCRCHQHLEQPLVAKAMFEMLDKAEDALPPEIEHQIPALRAELLSWEGQHRLAFEAWLAALDVARGTGDGLAESAALRKLAATQRMRARGDEALGWAEKAHAVARERGFDYQLLLIWTEKGRIQRSLGRDDLARGAWNEARGIARRLDHPRELFEIYLELWRMACADQDRGDSAHYLKELRRLSHLVDRLPRDACEALQVYERETTGQHVDIHEEEIR